MPFDPSKPFEVVGSADEPSGFDPSRPFEMVGADGEPPAFDSSRPFEPVHDSLADQVSGVASSLVTGIKRAVRDVDVLDRNRQGTGEPTASQRRRAMEMQAADPSWIRGRVGATGKLGFEGGVSQFGYPAKLEQVTRQGATERAATEFDIARQTEELNARPRSEAMRAWDAVPDGDWWGVVKAIAADPVEIIASITAESLPSSLVGVAGGPVGVGASSFATEYAGSLVGAAQAQGYDFSKPEEVARFFGNKAAVAEANRVAQARGATIGAMDALSAGLAGRFMGKAMGKGIGPVVGSGAKELGMQMAAGAGGEALGSVVAGQPVSIKDVVAEAIGELGGAPAEIVSNLREDAAMRSEKAEPSATHSPVPEETRVEPTGDEDLVLPPNREEVSGNGLQTQKEEEVTAGEVPAAAVNEEASAPPSESGAAAGADDWVGGLRESGVVPVNEPTEGESMDQFLGRRGQMLKVKERAAAIGVDVDVRWAPDLRTPDGQTVDGWVDPDTGAIVVNAASPAHASDAASMPVLREEAAHRLLGSGEGRVLVRQWAASRLTPDDVAGLQRAGYTVQPGESPQAYVERLSDEMIAKAAREQLPWWRDLVERVKVWVAEKSGGRIQLTNDEAARAVLRSLKRGQTNGTGGVPRMALGNVRTAGAANEDGVRKAYAEGAAEGKKWGGSLGRFDAAVKNYEASYPSWVEGANPGNPMVTAWEAGFTGNPPLEWVRAERIGPLPRDGTSVNFRDGMREPGVSVLRVDGESDQTDGLFEKFNDGDRYIIEGWRHYKNGSDGEPILVGAVVSKDQSPLRGGNVPRLSLGDPEPRRFGEQVVGAPDVSGEVKGRLRNLEYEPTHNETDAEMAARIVDEVGVDDAMAKFRDRSSKLSGAVRGMLAQVIVKRLASLEAVAVPAEAEKLADKAARFLDQDVFEATTDAGQFIQSFAAFAALTPRGMLGVYRRTVDRVNEGARRRVAPVLQEAEGEAVEINRAGVDKLAADRASQQSTRAAVDESVKASPDVRAAVRVVVAGGMGGNEVVRDAAEEAVRKAFRRVVAPPSNSQSLWARYVSSAVVRITAKPGGSAGRVMLADFTRDVASVLRSQVQAVIPAGPSGAPAGPGPTAIQRLVTILGNREKAVEVWSATVRALREAHPDDPRVEALAAQPAALFNEQLLSAVVREEMDAAGLSLRDMVAGHYRATGDGQTLVDRIVAQTGLEGEEAAALARRLDDTWRGMVFRERDRLDARIRSVRESESRLARASRSGLVNTEQVADSELDAAIRGQLRTARTNIGAILKQHFETRGRTLDDLARAFVDGARIPEAAARRLVGQLQDRMRELLRARRRAMLGRVREVLPASQRGRVSVDKLVDLADLGLLTEERAWTSIAEDLGLPAYSEAVAKDITARANSLRRIPEGFQRDEAAIDLLDHIANQRGMSVADLAMAMWYANTLSRPFTHLVNAASNMVQVGMHAAFSTMRNPSQIAGIIGSLADGFRAGADEALGVLKTGKTPFVRNLKLEASAPLERLTGDAAWERVLGKWKYVARALAASDMLFYKAAEGARRGVLARAIARREGRKGEALESRVVEILGRNEGAVAAANLRASSEGLTGERARRRVREILDASLPADVAQNAREHALDVIFNGEPYGLMGVMARGLGAILREAPALRLIVPFVRVVANVTNEGLNYVPPIGAGRALASHVWGAQLHGRDIDLNSEGGRQDLFDQYARAATGLAAIALLAALGSDDDDPTRRFRLHGPGPSDPNRKVQLRQQGWIPWSIQVGDRFVSYAETPVGLALAVAGAYVDALRYKKLDQVGTLDRVAIAATALPRVVVQRSFLRGVSDLLQSLAADTSPRRAGDKATAAAVRAASSFVVPGAFEQLDRLLDPTITDTSTVQGALTAAIPFVRRAGRPVLNVLGEPVSISPMSRFASKSSADPLWSVMAENRAWISKPDSAGLTDDQAYELTRVRGEILRPFLAARVELLRRLPEERAQQLVQQASAAATRQARAQMGLVRPRR